MDVGEIPGREAVGRRARPDHFTDHLVPRDDCRRVGRKVAIGDVQVGPTETACTEPDQKLAGLQHRGPVARPA